MSMLRKRHLHQLAYLVAASVFFLAGLHAEDQSVSSQSAQQPDALRSRIQPLIDSHDGKVAVVIKHLASDKEFRHDADEVMPTASLIKLPLMVAA